MPKAKDGAVGTGKQAKGQGKSKAKDKPTREVRRYDWDKILDGKEHTLERGKDFTGTTANAAGMVRYRARQRGVKVTAEPVDDKRIRVFPGEQRGPGRRPREA